MKSLLANDISAARIRAQEAYRQEPNSALAAYFNALLEENAEMAAGLFQKLVDKPAPSPYAGRALYRLALFNYARGSYIRARQFFLDYLNKYPNSEAGPQARYFAAKSLLISGETEKARQELQEVAQSFPGTMVAKFAHEDLASKISDRTTAADGKSQSLADSSKSSYAVQIGAFRSKENAQEQSRQVAKAGHKIDIEEKREGSFKYFVVRTGSFATREEAMSFADMLNQKFNLRSHVVRREK